MAIEYTYDDRKVTIIDLELEPHPDYWSGNEVLKEGTMIKVSKVTTGFSENVELADRVFTSVHAFDTEVLRLVADFPVTDLSYFKTDVTVTWEDGYEVSLRADINRTNNLAGEFKSRYVFYCQRRDGCPEWMTPQQWREAREDYEHFFREYAIN